MVLSKHSNWISILLYCAMMLNLRDYMGPRDSCGPASRTVAHNKCSQWVLKDAGARSGHSASSSRSQQISVRCVKAAIQFCSAVHSQATPTSCVLSLPQHSMVPSQGRGVPSINTLSLTTTVIGQQQEVFLRFFAVACTGRH